MSMKYQPRDGNGWRVPRTGTASKKIYLAMVDGKRRGQIITETGLDPRTVGVLMWKIRHPEDANAAAVRTYNKS